eukprot:132065-Chlamydomonas_euryale.AAC.1
MTRIAGASEKISIGFTPPPPGATRAASVAATAAAAAPRGASNRAAAKGDQASSAGASAANAGAAEATAAQRSALRRRDTDAPDVSRLLAQHADGWNPSFRVRRCRAEGDSPSGTAALSELNAARSGSGGGGGGPSPTVLPRLQLPALQPSESDVPGRQSLPAPRQQSSWRVSPSVRQQSGARAGSTHGGAGGAHGGGDSAHEGCAHGGCAHEGGAHGGG